MFDILKYPNRRKTIAAYIVFGAISLVFVFMGMNTDTNPMGGHVAVVNDTVISPKEYEMTYNNMTRFYGNLMGGMNLGSQNFLREMALNQLINQTLIKEYSPQLGVYVSKEEIQDFIVSIPAFQDGGSFRKELYFNYLQSQRLTPFSFETQLQREIALQKVRSIFESAVEVGELEIGNEMQLMVKVREGEYVRWDTQSLRGAYTPSSSEVKSWLGIEENAKLVETSYASESEKYKVSAAVKAKHILLKTMDKTADEKEAIRKKLEGLKKEVTAKNFSDLAKTNSEDSVSAKKGGDLGFFEKGQMVPEFEAAAFALEPGKVSDIVETNFGYHLILVEEKREEGKKSLEEVKEEIAKEKLYEQYVQKQEESLKTTMEDSKALSNWLKKNKLSWQKTGEISASSDSVAGAGRVPELIDELFHLKKEGELSSLRVGSSHFLVKLSKVSTKKEGMSPEGLEARVKQGYLDAMMSGWTQSLEKNADIQRNQNFLRE